MIHTEILNDGTLVKHYSDKGVLLLQNETGMKYADPIDCVPCRYTYSETDEPIESESIDKHIDNEEVINDELDENI